MLLMLVMGIAASSCSNDSCSDNGSSLPLATFYVGTVQQTVPGLTITGIGAPGDSLLLDSASVNEVYLPFRASATATSFMLQRWITRDTVSTRYRDTLTIDYDPIAYFHSIECGAMFNFKVKQVKCTTHAIDSVILLTPMVNNSRTPTLRIYFKQ